jgi:transposase
LLACHQNERYLKPASFFWREFVFASMLHGQALPHHHNYLENLMYFLGIDIAKETFDVALFHGKTIIASGHFDNTSTGFKQLQKWLKKKKATLIWACMEATGRYGNDLAFFLHQHGHHLSVVNPARIKKYAESQLQRNKTDQLDARLIADFCRTQEPALWSPPPPEKRELQEMVRRLNALVSEQTREQNRLQAGISSPVVIASIEKTLTFLAEEIASLEALIHSHIDHHPTLKDDKDLLTSIPGIGDKTAALILGELPDVSQFDNSGQAVAYAGLSPQKRESGSSVRKQTRLTKTGNQRLKTAMFFPAICALRHNPIVKALASRLEAKGKIRMVIVGAAMRKLLQLAYGVLKSQQPFDPLYNTNLQVTS